MAQVVFLRGVNVGGHKTFRPSELAKALRRFDVVNVGAAGTFIVRKPMARAALRAEIARRLPFDADVMICDGRDIARLASRDPFEGQPAGPQFVRFVSVLAKRRESPRPVPFDLPESGPWGVRVIECDRQFVLGIYRREMKAISWLGRLDKLFGAPVTTRNWNTIAAIAKTLDNGKSIIKER